MIREEIKRSIFDVKAIKHGIANLIATIEKSLTIADKGKAKRG